jgi:hypothetical protein
VGRADERAWVDGCASSLGGTALRLGRLVAGHAAFELRRLALELCGELKKIGATSARGTSLEGLSCETTALFGLLPQLIRTHNPSAKLI